MLPDHRGLEAPPSGWTVITGGTGGLGRELVRQFARAGGDTVLVSREPARGQAVADVIRAQLAGVAPAHTTGRVEAEVADLADPVSVGALAKRLLARPDGITVLINNAAQLVPARSVDARGVERSLAVNHLGPFLLTGLLMPSLRAHAPSAIVNISSASVQFGHPEDLQSAARFTPHRAYATAKLVSLAVAVELAERLGDGGVRVVAVDPGAMRTGMGEDMPGLLGFFNRRVKRDQQPIERTAATVLRAATDPSFGTGTVLNRKGAPLRLPRSVRPPEVRRRLWQETELLVDADFM